METEELYRCNPAEKFLFEEVILPTLSIRAHEYIFPQHEVIQSDGRRRKIDFAIITPQTKLAIELDGYTYHAEGRISPEQFSDGIQRQNELVLDDWKVIRFSWDQVNTETQKCRDFVRRAVIHDSELHISLNPYELTPHVIQKEALEKLDQARQNGLKRGLVVMATGLGKTYLSAFDAKRVGGRVLFIVHNNCILEQARNAFLKVNPRYSTGLYNGYSKEHDKDIVFANVTTLKKNFQQFKPEEFSYIIVDEFHHCAADSYSGVVNYFKPKFLLGLTATPNRTDQKSILSIVENNLIYQVTQHEAIEKGFLCPFFYYAFRDNIDYTQIRHNGYRYDLDDLNKALIVAKRDEAIIERYKSLTTEDKAIAFCVSIEHAERAAEHFRAAGITSVAIHSGLRMEERRKHIDDFRNGIYRVVFVRDIFNEGMDFPEVTTLLFMRPTESKVIFTQQLGRGLRLSSGKKGVKVLDFIGNYINADRIIDYLSEYSTKKPTWKDLKEKPVFYYDNGCEIIFQGSAIDIITRLDQTVITESLLLDDFFSLSGRLGHVPSVSDIQIRGKYKIWHYLRQFKTWNNFVNRIAILDSELDISRLDLLSHYKNIDVESLGDLLEENIAEFKEMLTNSVELLEQIEASFQALIKCFSSRREVNKFLGNIYENSKSVDQALKHISFILSCKFTSTEEKASPSSKDEQSKDAALVAKKLSILYDMRESYVLPRLFYAKLGSMRKFTELAKAYGTPIVADEIAHLKDVLALGLQVSKIIADIQSLSKRLLDVEET